MFLEITLIQRECYDNNKLRQQYDADNFDVKACPELAAGEY